MSPYKADKIVQKHIKVICHNNYSYIGKYISIATAALHPEDGYFQRTTKQEKPSIFLYLLK